MLFYLVSVIVPYFLLQLKAGQSYKIYCILKFFTTSSREAIIWEKEIKLANKIYVEYILRLR
jgi:hypothetical protein